MTVDETDAKPSPKTSAALAASLAAYEAEMILHCARLGAGGLRRMPLVTNLPVLCRRFLQARPDSEPLLLKLLTAHRQLVAEMLQLDGSEVAAVSARTALAQVLHELQLKLAGR